MRRGALQSYCKEQASPAVCPRDEAFRDNRYRPLQDAQSLQFSFEL